MNQAFISDFDNTLTRGDFYHLVIDHYYPDGVKLHRLFEDQSITVSELLIQLFKNINQPESRVIQDLQNLTIEKGAAEFIKEYTDRYGDFFILSAGCEYYIRKFLQYHKLDDRVKIFANPGTYEEDRYLLMNPNPHSPFYSKESGIDKGKVILSLKSRYDQVIFAGDSRPDFGAAKHASRTFARKNASLEELLKENAIAYTPFETFEDIAHSLGISLSM